MPKRPAHVTSGVQRSFTQEDESGYVSDECPKAYSYGESEKDDTSDEQEIQPGQSIQLCFDELSDEDVVQCGLKDVRQKELGDDENSGKNVPSSEQEDHPVRHLFDDMLAKEKEPKEKLKEKSKRKSREVASGRARDLFSPGPGDVVSSSGGVPSVPAQVPPESSVLVPGSSSSGSASADLKSSVPGSSVSDPLEADPDPSQVPEVHTWSELNNLGKSLRRFFKANVDLPKRERGDYAEGNWLHYMSLVSFSGEARNAAAPYISEFKRVLLATNENIAKVCSRPDVAYEAVRLFEQQEVDVAVNAHLTMRLKEAVAEPGMIATTYYQLLGELTDDRMAELKGAVLRNRDMSSVSEKPIVDPGNASVQAGAPTALEEPTVGPVTAVQSAGPLTFDRPLSDIAEGDEDKEEDEERLVRTHQPRAARSGLEREDNGRGVEESGRSDSGRRGTSAHSAVSVTDDENDEVDGDHDSRSSPGPGSVAYRTTEVLAALGREHSSLMWEKLGRVLNVYEADLSEGRRPRPNIRKRSRDLHLERDIAGLEDQMQGLLGMYHVARESGELVLRRDPKRRKTTWLEQ